LAENNLLSDGGDAVAQIKYLTESISCLERIKRNYNDWKYSQRFEAENLESQYLKDETLLMEKILKPIFK
jgi:hypothetical protein